MVVADDQEQARRADLDALARLAAKVCDVPTAALNVLDDERQHSLGAFGWEPEDVDVDETLCAKSVLLRDVTYTEDAGTDERWPDDPFTDGRYAEVKLYAAAPLVLDDGDVAGTLCTFSEAEGSLTRVQLEMLRDLAAVAVRILELHDANQKLGTEALRDALTGLPNRTLLIEELHRLLARHARGGAAPSVLFLDVNGGFKLVNDVHGHHVGDELLRAIAARLLDTVRATDLFGRWGGDEFVVVCDAGGVNGLDALVSRVRAAFDEPFELSTGPARVGVSVGQAVATDGDTAQSLLTTADAAIYLDKRSGARVRAAG